MSWRRGADFCTIGAVQNGVGMSDPAGLDQLSTCLRGRAWDGGWAGEVAFILLVGSPDCSR